LAQLKRSVFTHDPKSAQPEVGNLVRTILQQPTHRLAEAQLKRIVLELEKRFPKAAGILDSAAADLLSHMHFPSSHWRRIRSTNPLERLNREIRRRTDVVGIFPNRSATTRLAGAILLEQHEDWMTGKRYFSEQSMSKLYESVTQKSSAEVAAI
jgi:putative transposase